MNYIRHLNAFFSFVRSDKRLTSTNVSLYFALFYYWNFNRFNNPFTIYRENILQLCKLSKNTYHKSLKQLHEAQYIYYHPSPSKFQVVRISIVRLDMEPEKTKFKQLDLFSQILPPLGGDTEGGRTKIETGTVSNLILHGINIETGTVANLRHSINQTNTKQNSVQKTHTEIFEKNREINEKLNGLAGVSNSIHLENSFFSKNKALRNTGINEQDKDQQGAHAQNIPSLEGLGVGPSITEVENFFNQNNYPIKEAQKFFYYNQGKNWMLTEKLPVTDWKALAKKWMLNSKQKSEQPMDLNHTIQYLYERYLDGEKINKLLQQEFADHLQLEITEPIKQEAIQRRLNQLSGSNETSELNLWKAYMKEDYTDQLLINDESNLMALAKRLAVSKHFQKLKARNQQNVFSANSE